MTVDQIRSIGWLNCADGSVNLTPCLNGNSMHCVVNVPRDAFEKVRHDDVLMKLLAVQVFNQQQPTNPVKALAEKFAEENGLDTSAVECAMLGTLARIDAALAKGETLSPELIEAALRHWFKSQEKYYSDLLNNKDGALDTLRNNVIAQLTDVGDQ
ncbi:hypothetical protein PSH47_16125 [Pseudoalteromonas sp. CST5]|uniref:hypothetical protein n=1 Tax=unclassified Pseudoalteromonas TaxID=194690 RepID=UPI00235938BA|nr:MULTISPECIES: hypothetical protein [unclassified Pseudoalteromonas]MDC9514408.1 hypothetical protein [Pseudoalteromonas sp. CST1]MDC9538854.1 hypothetical protein [Pseudoalteromonas sp. CST3]MDC9543119.1 hypothetical protein [Pseudoalteromonas sp. CST2]MDC9545822.1 hypothetical protein [Pseudoalteromonas sp. CST4]MDC9550662.1 hypothetical protein [Pseudoalteromonas sp. CST5]